MYTKPDDKGRMNMSELNLVRISIKQVQIGMLCAEDIYNTSGLLLVPQNTRITQNHLFRMKLYQIFSILVVDDQSVPDEDEISAESFDNKYDENYNIFVNKYENITNQIKKHIIDIGLGKSIDTKALLETCNNLIKTVKSDSELFSYLYKLSKIDDYIYAHSLNVALISNVFGKWLHYSQTQIDELTLAGLLHDIGKIKIDQDILNKPSKLTPEEFKIVQKHTILGYDLLKPQQNLSYDIKMAVLQHHEKFDGSGYPLGFRNQQITDFSKIIAISDIYDAMTSDRSYHKSIAPFKVIGMFETEAYQLLDTGFLFTFLENIAHNYIGCNVELSNGETGKIVFINKKSPSRPLIQVEDKMYNLEFDSSIDIVKINN